MSGMITQRKQRRERGEKQRMKEEEIQRQTEGVIESLKAKKQMD